MAKHHNNSEKKWNVDNRVIVFIDGSNIEMAVKNNFERRVDPIKLSQKLAGDRPLMRINYYEAPLWSSVDPVSYKQQQDYFLSLKSNPLVDIKLGRRVPRGRNYTCEKCGHEGIEVSFVQKGVDMILALDIITLANRNAYDTVILIAGDQDFACPLLEVRMLGKTVENAFIDTEAWSSQLKDVSDKTIKLDDKYLMDCWH
jgi:uncharacterized LabA/DUF88 family protein